MEWNVPSPQSVKLSCEPWPYPLVPRRKWYDFWLIKGFIKNSRRTLRQLSNLSRVPNLWSQWGWCENNPQCPLRQGTVYLGEHLNAMSLTHRTTGACSLLTGQSRSCDLQCVHDVSSGCCQAELGILPYEWVSSRFLSASIWSSGVAVWAWWRRFMLAGVLLARQRQSHEKEPLLQNWPRLHLEVQDTHRAFFFATMPRDAPASP